MSPFARADVSIIVSMSILLLICMTLTLCSGVDLQQESCDSNELGACDKSAVHDKVQALQNGLNRDGDWWRNAQSIYDFSVSDIDGHQVSLDKYRGHVCIIVNVARQCGYTSTNYAQLQELYSKYAYSKGLRILAFPCNQFWQQEPGSNEEIKKYCVNAGVKFDVFSKIDVNGENADPLWKYLKLTLPDLGESIEWNFAKFIIDKNGHPVKRYSHSTDPLSLVDDLKEFF